MCGYEADISVRGLELQLSLLRAPKEKFRSVQHCRHSAMFDSMSAFRKVTREGERLSLGRKAAAQYKSDNLSCAYSIPGKCRFRGTLVEDERVPQREKRGELIAAERGDTIEAGSLR